MILINLGYEINFLTPDLKMSLMQSVSGKHRNWNFCGFHLEYTARLLRVEEEMGKVHGKQWEGCVCVGGGISRCP